MDEYLRPTEVMDWDHPEVQNLARALAHRVSGPTTIAKRIFEWVRDEIRHSGDFKVNQPTCSASEVLRHEAGWCFAKSHLLAALLRANGIAAGLCYQGSCRTARPRFAPPRPERGSTANSGGTESIREATRTAWMPGSIPRPRNWPGRSPSREKGTFER